MEYYKSVDGILAKVYNIAEVVSRKRNNASNAVFAATIGGFGFRGRQPSNPTRLYTMA